MRKFILGVIILFLLPALACSLGGGDDGGEAGLDADLAAATADAAEAEANAVKEDVDTVEDDTEVKNEEAQSADMESSEFTATSKLDELSSYKVSFLMKFDGQSGGFPSVGQIEMTLEVTKDPPARHLSMTMEGTTVEEMGGSNAIDLYSIGDTVYMKNDARGQETWFSFSGAEGESFESSFFAPDEQLEMPKTAKCSSQPETVNGVSARHCSFTVDDIEPQNETYDTVQGDVWIAEDGNYIVRYILSAQGYRAAEAEEGLFEFGDISYEYNLTDANSDFTITVPEEALNAGTGGGAGAGSAGFGDAESADFPMLENAEEVMTVAGFLSYYTSTGIPEVVEFYQQELPGMGWTENADQGYSDESTALLSFEKDNKMLMLTVSIEDGRTNVIITTVDQ